MTMDRREMIQEILIICRANNVPTTGDLYLSLVFRTDEELRSICREMNIK